MLQTPPTLREGREAPWCHWLEPSVPGPGVEKWGFLDKGTYFIFFLFACPINPLQPPPPYFVKECLVPAQGAGTLRAREPAVPQTQSWGGGRALSEGHVLGAAQALQGAEGGRERERAGCGRGQAAHDGGGDPFPRLEEPSLGYLGTPWREAQLLEGQPPTGAGAAGGCLWHPGNVYLLTSPSSPHDLRSFTAQTGALGLSDLQGSRQPGSDRPFPSAR